MITVRFICNNCGESFSAQIFEKGEAEEKRVPTSPVRCPRCGSTAVERRWYEKIRSKERKRGQISGKHRDAPKIIIFVAEKKKLVILGASRSPGAKMSTFRPDNSFKWIVYDVISVYYLGWPEKPKEQKMKQPERFSTDDLIDLAVTLTVCIGVIVVLLIVLILAVRYPVLVKDLLGSFSLSQATGVGVFLLFFYSLLKMILKRRSAKWQIIKKSINPYLLDWFYF